MIAEDMRATVLQLALQGRLVLQDPDDEPASVLLAKIRGERKRLVQEGKIKKDKEESLIFRGSPEIHGTVPGRFYEKAGKGEPVDITDQLPFEIPESWEWAKLYLVCNMQAGKNIASSKIFSGMNETSPFPCFGANGVRGYVSVYNNEGCFPIIGRQGSVGTVNFSGGKFYATEHAVVVRPYLIYVYWLRYILEALNLARYATATAQPGLSVAKISQVFCPLPPLAEQIRIAEKIAKIFSHLSTFQTSLDAVQRLNADCRKSILQRAIQGSLVPQEPGDEPASVLLQKIRKERKELIRSGKIRKPKSESVIFRRDGSWWEKRGGEEKCIDKEIPFEIPESWEWARLGEICHFINGDRGKNYPSKEKLSLSGAYPFISAVNLIHSKGISRDGLLFLSEEQYARLNSGKFSRGDIVVCIRGSLGKYAEIDMDKGAIASSLVILRPCVSIERRLLMAFLDSQTFRDQISYFNNGTAQPNLAASDLARFCVPIPPLNEQRRIADKVAQFMAMGENLTSALSA